MFLAEASPRITATIVGRLQQEEDIEVVGSVGDGEQAIQEALRLQPDIAIIDAGLPTLDGIQTTETLAQTLPRTGVILMSMDAENEAYRGAMLAGAREFFQKPFKGDDLVAAVRRVHAFEQRKAAALPAQVATPLAGPPPNAIPQVELGKMFVVASGSGGVGKSLIAANLAVVLKQEVTDARVALVDLALQYGDIAALINLPVDKTIADLAADDAIADTELIDEVMIEGPAGIRVLVAPSSPELADLVATAHLRALWEQLRERFDFIVVDLPSHLNELTLDTLEAADGIVVLAERSVTSLKNTRLLFQVLEALKIDSERVHVVSNTTRSGTTAIDRASAESMLKAPIEVDIPHDAAAVGPALAAGIPFATTAPQAPVSRALKDVAGRLTPRIGGAAPQTQDESKKQRRRLGFARA